MSGGIYYSAMIACSLSLLPNMIESTALQMPILCVRYYSAMIAGACCYLVCQDLEKMRREKQDLRVQFAREIEAAQAQLSEKESQLGYQHLTALEKLREENKQGN